MALLMDRGRKTWAVITGAGVIAAVVWGIYAWTFTGADDGQLAESSAPGAGTDGEGEGPTPLRATRPPRSTELPLRSGNGDGVASGPARSDGPRAAPATLGDGELSSGVRANTPASIGDPVEITLDRTASANAPARDAPASHGGIKTDDHSAESMLSTGRRALARGDQVGARVAFSRALAGPLSPSDEESICAELTGLSDRMLFSRATIPEDPLVGIHVVASGQTLSGIAKRYKITAELLAAINRITDPHRVRAGTRLKVIHGPFRAVIWKSRHRLDVYLGEVFVRRFRVGLGTNGGTPPGQWIVSTKLGNPDWTDPRTGQHFLADDPDNPVGERWIGLQCIEGECLGRVGFGIHGTIEPESIGENMSMGCVRLIPEEVTLVYDLLVERHSRVEILP